MFKEKFFDAVGIKKSKDFFFVKVGPHKGQLLQRKSQKSLTHVTSPHLNHIERKKRKEIKRKRPSKRKERGKDKK
jgi:hypothetical protein